VTDPPIAERLHPYGVVAQLLSFLGASNRNPTAPDRAGLGRSESEQLKDWLISPQRVNNVDERSLGIDVFVRKQEPFPTCPATSGNAGLGSVRPHLVEELDHAINHQRRAARLP